MRALSKVSGEASSEESGAAVEYLPRLGFVRRRRAETPSVAKSSTAASTTKIVCTGRDDDHDYSGHGFIGLK